MAKMRSMPGFVDVNSDMQIASPQVMVDIDRDRAAGAGRHAAADAGRACTAPTAAAGIADLCAGQ